MKYDDYLTVHKSYSVDEALLILCNTNGRKNNVELLGLKLKFWFVIFCLSAMYLLNVSDFLFSILVCTKHKNRTKK